jgi:hypothetical protein
MKLVAAESKLWWLVVADEVRPTKGLPIVDAVRTFAQTFQFVAVPTGLPGSSEGYRFTEGRVVLETGGTVAIKEATIFPDGVSVEVYSHTDDLLLVLEKILEALRGIGFREPVAPPRFLFNSVLSVDLDASINGFVRGFAEFSALLNEVLGVKNCEAQGLFFSADPKNAQPLRPSNFRLERRAGSEYAANRYFSFANTSTANHLRLVEAAERLMLRSVAN